MTNDREWGRRALLRGAAVVAGAAATAPLLGRTGTAHADDTAADALFKAGKFEQAGRAYEEILKSDPENLRAARQRGYVGLLANKFADAEKYLTTALRIAPDDKETNALLGDCYIRQDKLAQSAPCWRAAGEEGYAQWFGAVRGRPYEIHGDVGRARWLQTDPMPVVEASLNGGPPKRFSFYTGAPNLNLTASAAEAAGLTPVYKEKSEFEGTVIWVYYGYLDSFALGGIELRNVPVGWSSTESGADVSDDADGLIGTWVFYHLLTTFDYAGRSLVLRRPTPAAARKVRSDAARAGVKPLPIWLSRDHDVSSVGSVAGSGARVMGVNFGGTSGEAAAGLTGDVAERLGVRTDRDRPIETFAHSHPTVTYPCYPSEIRLGTAVANDVYCESDPNMPVNVPWPYGPGFDAIGRFSHCFFKPFTITLDFTAMNLFIARGKAA
ncbi:tetratricopeptide repeat protein [Actinomadura rayongensis]|uniref:Tetratricopeptide repeat protein n=1 Tax=Actinomadura rayongensis TaxID=1429076 RepID=A0A6I4W4L2_9ACTN|nr:tetratricopeptide repeat protein [Actinomadura rayongensis]